MQKIGSTKIFGVNISRISIEIFLNYIKYNISKNEKRIVGYANADTLNKIYRDGRLKKIINTFDLIHPDGIGIFLASKFLSGEKGLKERFTGSDLYPILTARALENNWSCFFFGHSRKILDFISVRHPRLKIAGVHEGYNFKTNEVIDKINKVNPDILIIGLSCPIQEQWISENKDKIKFKVALLVGDGIKIFAGKKIRGPVILRNMGLEWVTRYFTNPVQNFRKYVFGVPLFILRTLNAKIKSK